MIQNNTPAMVIRHVRKIAVFVIFQFYCLPVFANITLPRIFTDSLVVQREKPIKIWGWADGNEKISIKFHGQVKNTKADQSGQWSVTLQPEPAGGPYDLTVSGKNTISLKGILIGDVWVCSGQSNMEFQLSAAKNSANEILQADYNEIREYKVQHEISGIEKNDLAKGGKWETATRGNAGHFSAVAYFFARSVYEHTHVPIGLIDDCWGGTNIETWISHKALMSDSLFNKTLKASPPFNIDSLTAYQQSTNNKKIQELQHGLPDPKLVKSWKDASYDDSKWPKMELPGIWRLTSLGNVEGVVWYRKTIRLNTLSNDKGTLELPNVSQSDSTYVNGVLIGSTTNRPQSKRIYAIPPGILKQGSNVICVRISDSTNTGGIYGDVVDMNLLTRDTSISLAGSWLFQIEKTYNIPISMSPNNYPSLLFNAMIHPILGMAIKGVIWYQGETNAVRANDYSNAFHLLINDWRQQWQQNDLPFLYVQISSYNWANGDSNKGSTWAELREAQTNTLDMPNTGMAVTVDIGEANDIHPKNKQEVGRRLAAIALNKVYHSNINYKGPSYSGMEIKGDSIILTFVNTVTGLVIKDPYQYLKGFEIAGADHVFHYATAIIENNKVIVYAKSVKKPLAVHYAWADVAIDANLYNSDGFPAIPFRTDNWKNITKGIHYRILEIF